MFTFVESVGVWRWAKNRLDFGDDLLSDLGVHVISC